ncbi:MAG: pilus assembly protein TadG-related protein [Oligoflexia bacterium]|jgi:hypothetical protein
MGRSLDRALRASQLGQISVLAALMIGTTFFLFLAFVVNTGMVVHAKINLQNAADVAAYAGAATQARQMNQIALLNYEMRRQYKKFLYRYYVLGSSAAMTQRVGQGPVRWGPGSAHQVPAVCLIFQERDNYCQLSTLQPIATVSPGFLDAIGQALRQVLDRLEQLRQNNCQQISLGNLLALYLWLYNTESPESTLLGNSSTQPGSGGSDPNALAQNTLRFLTRGLGLVPKNLLLKKRIDSLTGFVNAPPRRNLSARQAETLASGGDFFARERTLQAFNSALRTLGPSLFNEERVFLDELLPQDTPLLTLDPVFAEFDTFAVIPEPQNDGACRQTYVSIPVSGRTLPVAVVKRPQSRNVHYAVRLRGKARVLFSPFGEIEMTAYAAAKPFGSRIGPPVTAQNFVRVGAQPGATFIASVTQPSGPLKAQVPNLAVLDPEEGTGTGKGWDNAQVFEAFFNTSIEPSETGGTALTAASVEAGTRAAMAPFLAEKGNYIIPVDLEVGPQGAPNPNREFFSFYSKVSEGTTQPRTTFYAPIKDRETQQLDPTQEIQDLLSSVQLPTALAPAAQTITRGLAQYFGFLRSGTSPTDEFETFNFARIANPIRTPDGANVALRGAGIPILMLSPDELRNSWGGAGLAPGRTNGRIGYSVKFISFRALRDEGLSIDPDTESVLDFIQH